jgi:hypothetical protein
MWTWINYLPYTIAAFGLLTGYAAAVHLSSWSRTVATFGLCLLVSVVAAGVGYLYRMVWPGGRHELRENVTPWHMLTHAFDEDEAPWAPEAWREVSETAVPLAAVFVSEELEMKLLAAEVDEARTEDLTTVEIEATLDEIQRYLGAWDRTREPVAVG